MILPYMSGFSMTAGAEGQQAELEVTELTAGMLPSDKTVIVTPDILSGFTAIDDTSAVEAWPDAPKDTKSYLAYGFDASSKNWSIAVFENGVFTNLTSGIFSAQAISSLLGNGVKVFYTSGELPEDAAVGTAPQPNDLTYSGDAQALVSAGQAQVGTMQYQLGTSDTQEPDGTWSDSVPEQTDADTYYVWYRAFVDDTNISDAACVSAEIAPQAVTVSGITANDKVYDGTTDADIVTDNVSFSGLIPGDSLTVSAAGAFEDANVGENKTVVISDLVLGGTSVDNYAIALEGNQTTTTADIEKRIAIIAAETQTVTIGGEIDTSLDKVIDLNLAANEKLTAAKLESSSTAVATKEGVITVNDAVIMNGEADVTANYNIFYLEGFLIVNEKEYIVRIAGGNRYDTAAAISQKYMVSADTVVLASGLNYADALAGVPLASKLNAPLLLTSDKDLNASTLAEIRRLGAKKVIILGGEGAVSEVVEKKLQAEALETERIFGKTRYSTAAAIAEKVNENPTDIFFVYGNDYPDALSVSAAAAAKNAPIIYLTKDGDLNADTAAYLAALKEKKCVKNAYVIGGAGVISDDMAGKAAEALGTGSVTRISGKNRYLTCIEVNKKFADVLTGESICVATGNDFPDALAGCVFAAQREMPMILVSNNLSAEQTEYLSSKTAENIYVIGGTGVVSDEIAQKVAQACKVPD